MPSAQAERLRRPCWTEPEVPRAPKGRPALLGRASGAASVWLASWRLRGVAEPTLRASATVQVPAHHRRPPRRRPPRVPQTARRAPDRSLDTAPADLRGVHASPSVQGAAEPDPPAGRRAGEDRAMPATRRWTPSVVPRTSPLGCSARPRPAAPTVPVPARPAAARTTAPTVRPGPGSSARPGPHRVPHPPPGEARRACEARTPSRPDRTNARDARRAPCAAPRARLRAPAPARAASRAARRAPATAGPATRVGPRSDRGSGASGWTRSRADAARRRAGRRSSAWSRRVGPAPDRDHPPPPPPRLDRRGAAPDPPRARPPRC